MGVAGNGVELDAGLPLPVVGTSPNGRSLINDEMLIAPGYLIPGQHYAQPYRRNRARPTPLRLPLYTHPRNVKP
jgi:hypothetical protein